MYGLPPLCAALRRLRWMSVLLGAASGTGGAPRVPWPRAGCDVRVGGGRRRRGLAFRDARRSAVHDKVGRRGEVQENSRLESQGLRPGQVVEGRGAGAWMLRRKELWAFAEASSFKNCAGSSSLTYAGRQCTQRSSRHTAPATTRRTQMRFIQIHGYITNQVRATHGFDERGSVQEIVADTDEQTRRRSSGMQTDESGNTRRKGHTPLT